METIKEGSLVSFIPFGKTQEVKGEVVMSILGSDKKPYYKIKVGDRFYLKQHKSVKLCS